MYQHLFFILFLRGKYYSWCNRPSAMISKTQTSKSEYTQIGKYSGFFTRVNVEYAQIQQLAENYVLRSRQGSSGTSAGRISVKVCPKPSVLNFS
jgi:hypothetical protein